MLGQAGCGAVDHGAGVHSVTDEQHQRDSGVTPDGVAEELIDSLDELGWAVPDLALADEGVSVSPPQQNVGLSTRSWPDGR
ncbi:hypothetical protein ABZV78_02585 [Micromonospora sp. NPDC004540]|uniref:hypothetical protein n=1 Tax=Micromonospora sp. NPDC004540 TaxID=3154457 RepID=UPI0033AE3256